VVVGVQGLIEPAGRAVGAKVIGGRRDDVAWVVDAAVAVAVEVVAEPGPSVAGPRGVPEVDQGGDQ
jgi:hypothetical protein